MVEGGNKHEVERFSHELVEVAARSSFLGPVCDMTGKTDQKPQRLEMSLALRGNIYIAYIHHTSVQAHGGTVDKWFAL